MSPTLQVYIISWDGQHNRASQIASSINQKRFPVTVVYSTGEDEARFSGVDAIRCDNALFWPDKFSHCLASFAADVMMVIHADCQCDDWNELCQKAVDTFAAYKFVGVWAPNIDFTYFSLGRVGLFRLDTLSLHAVAQTDGIVFAISASIASRMRTVDYSTTQYGWGIDWIFVTAAYATGLIAVIDTRVKVIHPKNSGYDHEAAKKQMEGFLAANLTDSENALYVLFNNIYVWRLYSRLHYLEFASAR